MNVFVYNTSSNLDKPSTKQIASRIFDFPLPLKPVIALNDGSKSVISTRLPYDLNPSNIKCNISPAPLRHV
ncbi:hypothetical protein DERP_013865 [Dermatophagoides pteronyssinus]|uniref:Uncharacterized protein n=1 Tax=Dermatophagoides pteronyssinus TaxID=6956 RepID=A0ABQ8J2V0_DERPT|nr:hypothetical protein DERP_013865 [Dermatophagoides pteronyssinus]